MHICKKEACTGCTACVSACAQGAITIEYSEKGFVYPVVNTEKCVECSVCQKTCPANQQHKNMMSSYVLACWNKNNNVRWKSTSGGVFYSLAKWIIKHGGIVYGAAFDQNMEVRHQRTDAESDLPMFSGSKYVQSNCTGIYQAVKSDLKNGKTVLFSGTPCQISGLKNYLKSPYENLICVDLICHGVPSPMVFKDYTRYQIQKYKSDIQNISFRYKKPCWSVSSMRIVFENGTEYIASKFRDPYLYFFPVGEVI